MKKYHTDRIVLYSN